MTDCDTKLPAHQFLNDLGIEYEACNFSTDIEKGAASVARALGFRDRQMVKTLIFETDKGERSLIMVGGDQKVVSGKLKKALGTRNISLAKPEIVKASTGYEIGSIPPFHWQPPGFRSFIDAALMEESILGVGAGIRGFEILIKPDDLVRASSAIIVDLCSAVD